MKAAFLIALGVALVVPVAVSAQGVPRLETMHAKVVAKYGATQLATSTRANIQSLELTLTDKRFRGQWVGFGDSASAIARFAVAALPSGYHPDSITVRIVTADGGVPGVKRTQTSSKTFAVAKLR